MVSLNLNYLSFFILLFMICLHSSNPGHPFCSGVTLSKLAAVTTDEQGSETFDTSGALDKLRKVSTISILLTVLSYFKICYLNVS